MRPSDEIFAQIAIRKGYVEPADVEHAKQHLRRLGGRLKTVPTLGAVLRRLGSMTRGQLRIVEDELEKHKHRCEKCDTVFYTLDQTRRERCDACRSEVREPLSLLPKKPRESRPEPPSPEQRNPFARPRSSWQSPAGRARSRASAFYGDLGGPAPPANPHEREADPTPSEAPRTRNETFPSAGTSTDAAAAGSAGTATPGSARLRRASAFFSDLADAAPGADRSSDRETPASRRVSPGTTTAPLDTTASPDLQRRRRAAAFFGDSTQGSETQGAQTAQPFAAAAPFASMAPVSESLPAEAADTVVSPAPRASEPPETDEAPRLQLVLDPVPPPPTALAETRDFASLETEPPVTEGAPTRRLMPDGLEEDGAQTVLSPPDSPEARATAPTMVFGDTPSAPLEPQPEAALEVREELSPEAQRGKEGLEGRVLSGFRVLRLLGKGGMGAVYLAEQLDLDRKVALKVLSPRLTRDRRQVEQFFREARALARVEHRNIVTIYHVGSEDDIHFLAMQLVRGGSLAERLRQRSPLPVDEAVEAVRQIARGLCAAHDAGIVHRDVKPDNVLVAEEADAVVYKVTDFGLARIEGEGSAFATGKIVGTPFYMSPEQVDGSSVDLRTDVYALGATFYHLLTGRPPFTGENAIDILLAHVNEPLLPPNELRREVPEALSAIVCRMMAKDPAARYANLRAFLDDLDRALSGAAVTVDLEAVRATPQAESSGGFDAPLPPMRTLLQPVVAERPRSLRVLLAGLAASALIATGLGVGPVRTLLADDAAPVLARLPRYELSAQQALERVVDGLGALSLPARAQALERFVRSHPETQAAQRATEQLEAVRAEIADAAHEHIERALERAQAERKARRPGPAIEALRAVPGWAREADTDGRLAAAEREIREALAQRGLAYVPEGTFLAGQRGQKAGTDRERTERTGGFYIATREVTAGEYAAYVANGGEPPASWKGPEPPAGAESLPVTGLTRAQAEGYAAFRGGRLPTALEWEKACRGTDGRRFPWGDEPLTSACNWGIDASARALPPGSFPDDRSPWGCLDMAGNVAELTLASRKPDAPLVVRGGSYGTHVLDNCRAAFYYQGDDVEGHPLVGLRLAFDTLPPERP